MIYAFPIQRSLHSKTTGLMSMFGSGLLGYGLLAIWVLFGFQTRAQSNPLLLDYCGLESNSGASEWISNVTFNGNANASSSASYSDFTSEPINWVASQGSTNTVQVTGTSTGGPWLEFVQIWIDWNQDGILEVSERFDMGSIVLSNNSESLSTTINVPPDALPGYTLMRVAMSYNTATGPCGNFSFGEVEDYLFFVVPSNPCSAVEIGTVALSSDEICPNSPISLNISGFEIPEWHGTCIILTAVQGAQSQTVFIPKDFSSGNETVTITAGDYALLNSLGINTSQSGILFEVAPTFYGFNPFVAFDQTVNSIGDLGLSGCFFSSTLLSMDVVPSTGIPTAAVKIPDGDQACVGSTLTLAGPPIGGNPGVNCTIQYRFSTNGGGSFSGIQSAIPSLQADDPGTYIIQARRANCLTGCGNSNWNTLAEWQVVAQPSPPTVFNKLPNVDAVCEGQVLTLNDPPSGGQEGALCALQYRFSTNAGQSWSAPMVSIPELIAIGAQNHVIQVRRAECQGNCNVTNWVNAATWSVNSPPLPPQSISGPTEVCEGEQIVLTPQGASLGSGAVYQWGILDLTSAFDPIEGENNPTLSIVPLASTIYALVLTGSTACVSSTAPVSIEVELLQPEECCQIPNFITLDEAQNPLSPPNALVRLCGNESVELVFDANGSLTLPEGGSFGAYLEPFGLGEPTFFPLSTGSITIDHTLGGELDEPLQGLFAFYGMVFRQDEDGASVLCTISETPKILEFLAENHPSCLLSTEHLDNGQITAYPNPFSNQLAIEFSLQAQQLLSISVHDAKGKTVFAESVRGQIGANKYQFDLSSLSPGVYFLSLHSAKVNYQAKIVKM